MDLRYSAHTLQDKENINIFVVVILVAGEAVSSIIFKRSFSKEYSRRLFFYILSEPLSYPLFGMILKSPNHKARFLRV